MYVNTPRAPVSAAAYTAAREALLRGHWDDYVERMLEVQAAEPEAADVVDPLQVEGDARS